LVSTITITMAPKREPYCTMNGRVFDAGHSGVALISDHPLCRIPHLVSGSSAIPVCPEQEGRVVWMRPERCITRDGPLLLHHFASINPEVHLTPPVFAALRKTSDRFCRLLNLLPWSPQLVLLDWPSPERLHFSLDPLNDRSCQELQPRLVQLETLELLNTSGCPSLLFCRTPPVLAPAPAAPIP
jgi:hypothetical protein